MKREQIRKLIELAEWNSYVTRDTRIKWGMAIIDALSETDEDAAFERLRRRFEKNYTVFYRSGLGGCTAPLVAA